MKQFYFLHTAKILEGFKVSGFEFKRNTTHVAIAITPNTKGYHQHDNDIILVRNFFDGIHHISCVDNKVIDKVKLKTRKVFVKFNRGDVVIRKDADKQTLPSVISSHRLNETYIWYQDAWGDYTNLSSGHPQDDIRLATKEEIHRNQWVVDRGLEMLKEIKERESKLIN